MAQPPSPASPIDELAEKLNQSTPLKGFAQVFAFKSELGKHAPPSIVLLPVEGGYQVARDRTSAFNDVDLTVSARLWGSNGREAWNLRARYIAALWEVAFGDLTDPDDDEAAGPKFELVKEKWDTTPDDGQQGQELEVVCAFVYSASDKSLKFGEVDEVGVHDENNVLPDINII